VPHTSRPPIKSKSLPLHFDTFGGLEHVLDQIDKFVPLVFKNEDISFIPTLKTTIRTQAIANKWNVIVLSLSKGMAREEIDIILNHPPDNVGPLVIDATAQTPEHEVIYNDTLLLTRKERIIRLNNETSDVLVVLYGVHGLDTPVERKLMMRRMHYMGVTLDMLIERDEAVEAGAGEEGYIGNLQKALWHIRNSITSNELHREHQGAGLLAIPIFLSLTYILAAYAMTHDEAFRDSLTGVRLSLLNIPDNLKAELQPLLNTADVIRANTLENTPAPQEKPALSPATPELKPVEAHAHKPSPQPHHHYEQIGPSPKPY
jgi:hypothetical protein